jgi:AcrR family transcriptional regulator
MNILMPHLTNVRIAVNDKVYLKDPATSELGREMLMRALPMIDELGLEGFTFRKLAAEIGTTESALYRYFESKHKLLLYYTSWYWGWTEYNLVFGTANLPTAEVKLERAIEIVTSAISVMNDPPFDLNKLERVIVSESSKAYLTKEVDMENKEGLFAQFKSLCNRVAELIEDFSPDYPYAHSLASLLFSSHLDQVYFAQHLPSLSDIGHDKGMGCDFYKSLIFRTIQQWPVK